VPILALSDGTIVDGASVVSAAVIFMFMSASTCAATLTFAWDPKPAGQKWTKLSLYEKSGATYTLLIEVAEPQLRRLSQTLRRERILS
jgi:hypothetical protein